MLTPQVASYSAHHSTTSGSGCPPDTWALHLTIVCGGNISGGDHCVRENVYLEKDAHWKVHNQVSMQTSARLDLLMKLFRPVLPRVRMMTLRLLSACFSVN